MAKLKIRGMTEIVRLSLNKDNNEFRVSIQQNDKTGMKARRRVLRQIGYITDSGERHTEVWKRHRPAETFIAEYGIDALIMKLKAAGYSKELI